MDFVTEFGKIEQEVSKKKAQMSALEERKRILEEDEARLLGQLKELNINSMEEAETYLANTEKSLSEGLKQCQEIMAKQ